MFKNINEVQEFIKENNIKFVDFKVVTLPGKWNHLTIPVERLSEKTFSEGIGFDGSSYGYSTIEDSDMRFLPDMTTAFVDPYCKIPTLSMIANMYTLGKNEGRFSGDPRFIAEKAEKYMRDMGIADEYVIGPEFEFYIFDHINFEVTNHHQEVCIDSKQAPWNTNNKEQNFGYKAPFQKSYHLGLPYDLNNDLRSEMCLKLEQMGIPVKYHHHEVGSAGQLEIEVELEKMSKMADATMMAKYLIKNEAVAHGKTATFMPKPLFGEAGSGMHVHMLLRKDGRNLFFDENGYSQMSRTALFFIGGILKHSKALLAFTNPSTNSYKRLVPGFEAPVSICFATGNRSAVIRIPGYVKDPETRRFEFRPSDGTANPYLAYSALLMAGIDGIANKINPTAEGFGPYDVNVFDLPKEERDKIDVLPRSLDDALEELKSDSGFLLKGGVFDEHFINNWIKFKYEKEIKKVMPVPSPIEFQLYYDL
ncbi:type I glutamate--ammonia ligase [Clostridium bowmanii]|uniref:type I glutamate--ammonia ligase n=1 Tax=Clostridium bowmanii TaxID=132925 RepID=UPI001C0C6713|nr:type I glutamate--ammonia ligase [Clostridium bowmanii]MBU3190983.1 type I glutamate--ammonia ligase [Clostridium bowmanii]MCA1075398.1 type I glutamate--ammonia ligase [Clostridium bowmanii]